MRKPRPITLAPGERIGAVVPERCAGPGWANSVVWVHIIGPHDGQCRQECLQPNEQTPEIRNIFDLGEIVHRMLISAVPICEKKP
jgi:hypothetical protein